MMIKKRSSKELITEAFKTLLRKKSFDQITVGDILETSGISRTTFYKFHYSKEALLLDLFHHEIMDDGFDYSKPLWQREATALEQLCQDKMLYLHALEVPSLQTAWTEWAYRCVYGFYQTDRVAPEDFEFVCRMAAAGFVHINQQYLNGAYACSPEEIGRRFETSIEQMLLGFAKPEA